MAFLRQQTRGGYWSIVWKEGRAQHSRKVSKSKQLAQEALRRLTEREERLAAGLGPRDIALSEWRAAHLATLQARVSAGDLSMATLKRSQEAMGHFLAWLEEERSEIRRLSQVSAAVLRDFQLARGTRRPGLWGRRARAKTTNTEMSLLSPAFREAFRDGILQANPMDRIRKLKERDSRPARKLGPEQVSRVLEGARKTDPELYPYLLGWAYTGARRNELYAVRWSDVDLPGRTMTLQNIKTHTDSRDRDRPMPLHPLLVRLLKQRKALERPWPALPGQSVRNRFHRVTKAAGMPWLTRIHDLRHAFAGAILSAGEDLTVVKELLGHRSIRTTERYADLVQTVRKRAVGKLRF